MLVPVRAAEAAGRERGGQRRRAWVVSGGRASPGAPLAERAKSRKSAAAR